MVPQGTHGAWPEDADHRDAGQRAAKVSGVPDPVADAARCKRRVGDEENGEEYGGIGMTKKMIIANGGKRPKAAVTPDTAPEAPSAR